MSNILAATLRATDATVDPGKAALPQSFDLTLEPSPPAIKTAEGNNPGAPAPGANSFTQAQAKSQIESRGYSNVSALKKDDNGIWRGTATKDGDAGKDRPPVNVSLDYQVVRTTRVETHPVSVPGSAP